MQICILTQTHNHASIPPLSFLEAGCPSCHPTNSIKALKAKSLHCYVIKSQYAICSQFGIGVDRSMAGINFYRVGLSKAQTMSLYVVLPMMWLTVITDCLSTGCNAIVYVRLSVCFHSIFQTDWPLALIFCIPLLAWDCIWRSSVRVRVKTWSVWSQSRRVFKYSMMTLLLVSD